MALPPNQAKNLGLSPHDKMATIETPSGEAWVVNEACAEQFEGFLKELEATGYVCKSAGGYAYRKIRGGNSLSQHAYGNAIDVNADENPLGATKNNFPPETAKLALKWGLSWGAEWRGRKDPMHFEVSRFLDEQSPSS